MCIRDSCQDASGRGPLLSFDPDVIQLLLEHDARPADQSNENGHSVLAGLCYANKIFRTKETDQLKCIRLLVEHGADIHLGYRPTNESPLHHATAAMGEDNIEVIRYLLENGANPNGRTVAGVHSHNFYHGAKTKGESPLHRAAAFCSEATIELLMAYGADKNLLDAHGDTPLSWACWYRRPKSLIDKLR